MKSIRFIISEKIDANSLLDSYWNQIGKNSKKDIRIDNDIHDYLTKLLKNNILLQERNYFVGNRRELLK